VISRFAVALPFFALAVSACTSEAGTVIPSTPTLVAVSPADFAGDVPCLDAPGAMRSYVATVFDRGTLDAPSDPFALPSGVLADQNGVYRPAPCERVTGFGFVIPGHRYDAEIDAYDQSDLHALGAGTRTLVSDATGEYVAPRWTTSCGRQPDLSAAGGPVTAAQYLTRFVRGCAALDEHAPATPTGISVSLDDALDGLTCGNADGSISFFTTTLPGQAPVSAACANSVEFDDLEPGRAYTFDVAAYELGGTAPRWTTSCHRTALFGAIVAAACDPLSEVVP
jgi:hypothetical protein